MATLQRLARKLPSPKSLMLMTQRDRSKIHLSDVEEAEIHLRYLEHKHPKRFQAIATIKAAMEVFDSNSYSTLTLLEKAGAGPRKPGLRPEPRLLDRASGDPGTAAPTLSS